MTVPLGREPLPLIPAQPEFNITLSVFAHPRPSTAITIMLDTKLDQLKRDQGVYKWREEHFSREAGVKRKADTVVRSADGVAFPTRLLHLAYGSDVFADLLATCGERRISAGNNTPEVIQMDERAEEGLDVFMSLVTPGALFKTPRWGIDSLLSALKLADKLDSTVLRLSLPHALEPYLSTHAALIFAHAVLAQHFALARLSLTNFYAELVYEERDEHPPYVAEDWLWSPPAKVTTAVSGCIVRVGDIPEALVDRFPLGLYCQLVRSQERLFIDWRTYRPADLMLEFEAAWDANFPNTRS